MEAREKALHSLSHKVSAASCSNATPMAQSLFLPQRILHFIFISMAKIILSFDTNKQLAKFMRKFSQREISAKAFCRSQECASSTLFISQCERVLPQNEMRFAAKWNAFCRKMERVLPQNGKRFAAKCIFKSSVWNVSLLKNAQPLSSHVGEWLRRVSSVYRTYL